MVVRANLILVDEIPVEIIQLSVTLLHGRPTGNREGEKMWGLNFFLFVSAKQNLTLVLYTVYVLNVNIISIQMSLVRIFGET